MLTIFDIGPHIVKIQIFAVRRRRQQRAVKKSGDKSWDGEKTTFPLPFGFDSSADVDEHDITAQRYYKTADIPTFVATPAHRRVG